MSTPDAASTIVVICAVLLALATTLLTFLAIAATATAFYSLWG